ncbi:MAG: exodeoxyribonuclease VII small subunit [Chloroflexi bacterium]|nr:exodeoxyribonuclease VII small subunit [Chloroflexota bacterium]
MYDRCTVSAKHQPDLDFEQAFQRLEETVQALEKGGLTLAQSTSLYEEGMRLAKICSQRLDTAELKITELQNAFLSQVNGQGASNG